MLLTRNSFQSINFLHFCANESSSIAEARNHRSMKFKIRGEEVHGMWILKIPSEIPYKNYWRNSSGKSFRNNISNSWKKSIWNSWSSSIRNAIQKTREKFRMNSFLQELLPGILSGTLSGTPLWVLLSTLFWFPAEIPDSTEISSEVLSRFFVSEVRGIEIFRDFFFLVFYMEFLN